MTSRARELTLVLTVALLAGGLAGCGGDDAVEPTDGGHPAAHGSEADTSSFGELGDPAAADAEILV